ncbi:hypothetical protein MP228_008002 [Amoeboaphelidium protococcarum]|nr:hypothetical protein MP228_008002 [Amoeboaphelidium protococcarum]
MALLLGRKIRLVLSVSHLFADTQMRDIADAVKSLNLWQGSAIDFIITQSPQSGGLSAGEIRSKFTAFSRAIPSFITVRLKITPPQQDFQRIGEDVLAQQQQVNAMYATLQNPGSIIQLKGPVDCKAFSATLRALPKLLVQFSRDFVHYRTGAKKIELISDLIITLDDRSSDSIQSCLTQHLLPALQSAPITNIKMYLKQVYPSSQMQMILEKLRQVDLQKTLIKVYNLDVYGMQDPLLHNFKLLAANTEIYEELL